MDRLKSLLKKVGRIMSFAKPFWHLYAAMAGFALLFQLIGLILPWLNKIFFDDVLINKKLELLFIIIMAILAAYLTTQAMNILASLIRIRLSQKQQIHIRLKIYEHLQKLPLGFFHEKKVGDLLTRINSDSMAIESFINVMISTFFIGLINLAATVYISLKINPQVTLIAAGILPFYIISERFWVKRLKDYAQKLRIKGADLFSFLQESISAVKLTKLFNREKKMTDDYANATNDYNRLAFKEEVTRDLSSFMNGFILYLPSFVVLVVGGYQVILGLLTVGGLIALQQYIGRLLGPLNSFVMLNRSVQLQMISINRIFEILDTQPEVVDRPGAKELGPIAGRIEFKNLAFEYEKEKPVLSDISAIIEPRRHIGLVGPSGGGKSTLVNLLFRFYDPQAGAILLDGADVRDIKINSLRSKIGFVSQDVIIFNRSIKDNIAFGKSEAGMAEIISAAKMAGIHEAIMKLSQQYETVVGERGETLSGGERQRLSIAQVILTNPDIIIFDEPTSYLDSETEEKVKSALDQITADKTTIIIAHRLSTLKNVDAIWFLENGRILEQGSFNELLDKKGRFFQYYLSQFGGFEIFQDRLKDELERAVKYQEPFSLVELTVENWRYFDRDPLAGNQMIFDALLALVIQLEATHLITELPHKRGSFLIAVPEVTKASLTQVINEAHSIISKKFHGFKIELRTIIASDSLTEEEKSLVEQFLKSEQHNKS